MKSTTEKSLTSGADLPGADSRNTLFINMLHINIRGRSIEKDVGLPGSLKVTI